MEEEEHDNDWIARRWQGEGRVVRPTDPRLRPAHEQSKRGADQERPDTDIQGHAGKHCTQCRMLDFLPIKCSGCGLAFCASCSRQSEHHCTGAAAPPPRVIPVCPLCDAPVSCKPGQDPNSAVELHIRQGCKPVARPTLCSHPRCKRKVQVPILCRDCGLNFCVKHRMPNVHKCGQVQHKTTDTRAGPGPTSAVRYQAQLEQLVSMGYSHAAASAALRVSKGDVQLAATTLLDDCISSGRHTQEASASVRTRA